MRGFIHDHVGKYQVVGIAEFLGAVADGGCAGADTDGCAIRGESWTDTIQTIDDPFAGEGVGEVKIGAIEGCRADIVQADAARCAACAIHQPRPCPGPCIAALRSGCGDRGVAGQSAEYRIVEQGGCAGRRTDVGCGTAIQFGDGAIYGFGDVVVAHGGDFFAVTGCCEPKGWNQKPCECPIRFHTRNVFIG